MALTGQEYPHLFCLAPPFTGDGVPSGGGAGGFEDFPTTLTFREEWVAYVSLLTNMLIPLCPVHRQLAKSLGQAGEIEPETEGILTEYGVDFSDFSSEVLECLPQGLPWTIPPEEFSKRRDLR